MVEQAADRIIIMPGSGVRSNNIAALAAFTGVKELHSSARKMTPSAMLYTRQSMEEDLSSVSVDTEEIQKMKTALQHH
jgi:copper homeostasis protein